MWSMVRCVKSLPQIARIFTEPTAENILPQIALSQNHLLRRTSHRLHRFSQMLLLEKNLPQNTRISQNLLA